MFASILPSASRLLIFDSSFENGHSDAIKLIFKSCCILRRSLHRIVPQNVEISLALSQSGPGFVVDGQVDLQAKLLVGEGFFGKEHSLFVGQLWREHDLVLEEDCSGTCFPVLKGILGKGML